MICGVFERELCIEARVKVCVLEGLLDCSLVHSLSGMVFAGFASSHRH
jgi:hypothetical protein